MSEQDLGEQFERWIASIDERVIAKNPSLEYALDDKRATADGAERQGDYSRSASWSQPIGFVTVALIGDRVRVMGLPTILQGHPALTPEERKQQQRQEKHRFEDWINELSDANAQRVAESIVAYLRGYAED